MSGDMMSFPDNWRTFVQQYQFADKEEIYTNGSMLIPSFRVRQMVEHYFGGEVGKTSHYSELFGTPERAARTWIDYSGIMRCADCPICRDERGVTCEIPDGCVWEDEDHGYNALLEWLRGDA